MDATIILERGEAVKVIADGHAVTLGFDERGRFVLSSDRYLSQPKRALTGDVLTFVAWTREAAEMSTSDGLGR